MLITVFIALLQWHGLRQLLSRILNEVEDFARRISHGPTTRLQSACRDLVREYFEAVLGVASWLPAEEMIRTGADGRLEHAAAYLISGLAVFTAYPRRLTWLTAILMMCYAGILEFGQLWVPGRHAGILDWAASSGGVLCALLLYDTYQRVFASAGDAEA